MKQRFLTGIMILLPIAVTLSILIFIINAVTRPFHLYAQSWLHSFNLFEGGLWDGFITQQQLNSLFSVVFILIVLFFSISFFGMMGRRLLMKAFITFFDNTLLATPLIRKIYKLCKDLTQLFFVSKKRQFSEVVLVPFLIEGQSILGFVTNEIIISHEGGKRYLGVLVPGSPNPLVGFLLFFPEEAVKRTLVPTDEGIKWIISCGSATTSVLMDTIHERESKKKR